MAKRLEVVVNLALLATCILASAVLLQKLFPRGGRSSDAVAKLEVGDTLPSSWRVDVEAKRPRLVAVVRSTCRFCTDSLSFYKDGVVAAGFPLVAVSDEPAEVTQTYLTQHGVHDAQIVSVPTSTLGVSGTPTVFAVDGRGVIRAREVGKLRPEGERHIVATLVALR